MPLQFIVLLAIMAIWALTSLLSRDAQPLPPRPIRGPGPDGTRPSPIGRSGQAGPGRFAGTAERLSGSGPARPVAGRGLGRDDGIVILESDARGTRPFSGTLSASPSATTARNPRGGQSRRSSRGRSSSSANPTRQAETGSPRALTSQISQSMALTQGRPLELTPLDAPFAPLGAPLVHLATSALREQPKSWDVLPAFDSASVRNMLASRNKLREVALLSEILQPPLALRRARRPR
ncbi:MAG: hypothetical protein ACHRXM_13585 [Isosphaerales bacterium]